MDETTVCGVVLGIDLTPNVVRIHGIGGRYGWALCFGQYEVYRTLYDHETPEKADEAAKRDLPAIMSRMFHNAALAKAKAA